MSYQDVIQNPELLQVLLRRARCERAEALHRLIRRLWTGRSTPRRVLDCRSAAHA